MSLFGQGISANFFAYIFFGLDFLYISLFFGQEISANFFWGAYFFVRGGHILFLSAHKVLFLLLHTYLNSKNISKYFC
jgi:hypothetical protein